MKIYLLKDVEKVGMAGEIIKVSDGYAANFILPRKLGVKVTEENEHTFKERIKNVENRKEVVAAATSMLAEKIKSLKLTIKRKVQAAESAKSSKLYGAINAGEIADLLAENGINVSKNQVIFDKSIKETGSYDVTIKLSSRLQPVLNLKVVAE